MAISDWLDCMPHTVTVSTYLSIDKYGKRSVGSSTDYSARVKYKDQVVLDTNPNSDTRGEEIIANGQIWIQAASGIDYNDEITLPNGDTPRIVSVQHIPDEDGDHHLKIWFKG